MGNSRGHLPLLDAWGLAPPPSAQLLTDGGFQIITSDLNQTVCGIFSHGIIVNPFSAQSLLAKATAEVMFSIVRSWLDGRSYQSLAD